MVKERILVLGNASCVGVFLRPTAGEDEDTGVHSTSSKLFIILSSSAEYSYIRSGDHEYQHQTRFTPHRFQAYVMKMIAFRNLFSDRPYLTMRFINKEFVNTTLISSSNCNDDEDFAATIDHSSWRRLRLSFSDFSSTSNSRYSSRSIPAVGLLGLYVCLSQQRICVVRRRPLYSDDTCIEIPLRGTIEASPHAYDSLTMATIYPRAQVPSCLHDLFTPQEEADDAIGQQQSAGVLLWLQDDLLDSRTAVMHRSANRDEQSIRALMSSMSLLGSCADAYPSLSASIRGGGERGRGRGGGALQPTAGDGDATPMVEYLDGAVYLLSDSRTPSSSTDHDSEMEVQCWLSEMEVQCWLDGPTNILDSMQALLRRHVATGGDGDSGLGDSSDGVHASADSASGSSIVIALRGEYFTAFLSGNRQLSFHFSFVQHQLGRSFHHSPSNSCSSSAVDSIDAFVRVHCRHLLKLLLYREHLLRNCSALMRRRRNTSRSLKERSLPSSCSLRAVDSIYMTTTHGVFTALLSPTGSLTMAIRAMFHDRTIVKLDLALQVFSIITPDGEEVTVPAGAHLMDSIRSPPVHHRLQAYIEQVLSFYQWAALPDDQRDEETRRRQQAATIARAAALNSHRHALMHQVSARQITAQEAFSRSCALERQLSSGIEQGARKAAVQFAPSTSRLIAEGEARRRRYNISVDDATNASCPRPVCLMSEEFSHEIGAYMDTTPASRNTSSVTQDTQCCSNTNNIVCQGSFASGRTYSKVVSPDGVVYRAVDAIADSSSSAAGRYVHRNASMSSSSSCYPRELTPADRHYDLHQRRQACHSIIDIPVEDYLERTFVQDALHQSRMVMQSNVDFLASRHVHSVGLSS